MIAEQLNRIEALLKGLQRPEESCGGGRRKDDPNPVVCNVVTDTLQPQWISVETELPDVGDCVVACHQYSDGAINAVCCTYYEFGFPLAMWNIENPVSHWMRLPEPTK
ncbi:MAG: hypothetical protein COA78_25160 [Blastopirellula sp.]|nr:MAG: hypothetical protein COA78_25160 [Blastopirellula sp.]